MLSFVRKTMSVVTSMLLLMMTYASVSHSEGEQNQVKELIVCDGEDVLFECQPGERLRIFSARYGVTTLLSQCNGKEYSSEYVPCWKDIALNDIQCTPYQTCRLQPPKDPRMYKPDPCTRISTNYLNVTYSCLIELIVCDGEDVLFECQPGERLRIFSARYGVTTLLSQCNGKEYSSEYVPCWKDIALNDIQCTPYQTCRLQPPKDPRMYKPDPCTKISTNYLNVTYSCLIGETPTEPPPVSVVDECQCPCDDVGPNQWGYLQDLGLTLEEMREIMMPFLESLKDNVTIDRKATSKFLRSKMSAADHRSSTTSIGSAGVVIIVTVIALLVVVDVLDVCVWFKQRFVAKSKVAVQNQGNPADELLS